MNKSRLFCFLTVCAAVLFLGSSTLLLTGCSKDSAADDGKAAAKSMCKCFQNFDKAIENLDEESDADMLKFITAIGNLQNCIENLEKKYSKYENSNNDDFLDAFEKEIEKCNIDWDMLDLLDFD